MDRTNQGPFDIECGTFSLFEAKDGIKKRPALFSEKRQYRIPVYQRPYSWGENNIRRLLEDIRDTLKNDEPVFMGTMQLSEPSTDASGINTYDIIDGQQRITTFIILLALLGVLPKHVRKIRTFVNRGKAQEDLDEFWISLDNWSETKNKQQDFIHNPYLRNALMIDVLLNELFDGEDDGPDKAPTREDLSFFINNNVLFVVIETHANLSKTLKIFNTINTAGLDLGADDLFKIRFYEYLKQHDEREDMFDQISNIYARVAQGKKEGKLGCPTMGELLSTYQRVLVAKYDLSNNAFNMGYERFYDQLFDTLLNIRDWPDFKKLKTNKPCMSIDELNTLFDCFTTRGNLLSSDWDFHIIERFFWETRYGEQIWNMDVIALFFGAIKEKQLYPFALSIFKLVCPPSLYFAKRVYGVISSLVQILKQMPTCNSILEQIDACFNNWRIDNRDMRSALSESFEHEIASYPKWKNLLCRLVEYLESLEIGDKEYETLYRRLFVWDIDIEHIQCATDESNAEQVRKEWGKELNSLGNLVVLERKINHQIKNYTRKKDEGYSESAFISVKELQSRVGLDDNKQSRWKLKDAIERRKNKTNKINKFVFGSND